MTSRVPAPDVVHRTADLPDGRLHYVEAGTGAPLILLHGGHGSWTHWIANIEALSKTRRVLALDQPGFGQSYNPEPAYDIPEFARTVSQLIDALALERVALAGFSFGCMISAATAAREPARVTHVVMANPPGIGERNPEVPALQAEHSRISKEQGLKQGMLASLRDLQLHHHELIDDDLVALGMKNVRGTRRVTRGLAYRSTMAKTLAEVKQPLLVLMGEFDRLQQYRREERIGIIREAAPQARIEHVAGAAHWLPYDTPAAFYALTADFVGR